MSGQELKLQRWLSDGDCQTAGYNLNLAFAGCILQLLGSTVQSVQNEAALSCYVTCIRAMAAGDQQTSVGRYASQSQQSVPSDSARVRFLCRLSCMRGNYCDGLMPALPFMPGDATRRVWPVPATKDEKQLRGPESIFVGPFIARQMQPSLKGSLSEF
ncbi:hypothetical protein C8R45DRAFT_18115 [Mycena sanguinolenta]|nr:hypothetical protein C8R45DRAFT_18115 [Mycena sanguinolenta]